MLKYKLITEELLSEISSGHLAPGSRLPSTREIESRFGVSQITALRVFKELQGTGKVICRRGAGYFVKGSADDPSSSSQRLFCAFRPPKPFNLDDNFGTRIMCGLIDAASAHHRSLEFSRVRLSWDNLGHVHDELAEAVARDLTGQSETPSAIILDSMFTDSQIKRYLKPASHGVPIVVCGRRSAEAVISVHANFQAIAEELGRLACQCHAGRHFLFPIDSMYDGEDFCTAYMQYLLAHGVAACDIVEIGGGLQDTSELHQTLNAIAEDCRSGRRICLFAPHDHMGMTLHRACLDRGLVPGRNLALLSCGNLERTQTLTPPLTTVELYPEAIGQEAITSIANLNLAPRHVIHSPHTLILNETWNINR